jgi:pimeloyl-ACP methyl ester carboxylesterase
MAQMSIWRWSVVGAAAISSLLAARSAMQTPSVRTLDERAMREYAGVYRWESGAFLEIQPWTEIVPARQLVALDDSGEARALHALDGDRFFTGPGIATRTTIESREQFARDPGGRVTSLTWQREGEAPRTARRVEIERSIDVQFSSGDLRLAGTLIVPAQGTRHPAVVLVHGSGPATREQILPFARFLVRRGVAVLAYDKRGAGASTGDWTTASFDDLAADAAAAVAHLRTRSEIDASRIGLLGVSQAGWIMPLVATRVEGLAFLVSVSGAGVPVAETTIDHAQSEMTASGMKPEMVSRLIEMMKLQYHYARTGEGWDDYARAREQLAAKIGPPPESFPAAPSHPSWRLLKAIYFHDPAPVLARLRVPTLALFGALDNNILAGKNRAAWESALAAGGHPDYTLVTLANANHSMLEARVGTNAEMKELRRFVPDYATTVGTWLETRLFTTRAR